jgi:hypothetical protein
MIRFTLRCSKDHQFESWFTSSSAFDGLRAAGHLTCPICGDGQIDKALMAPAVATHTAPEPMAKAPTGIGAGADAAQVKGLAAQTELARKMAELREMVETNSDYVGQNFAAEARAMYLGDIPARPIYGEAKSDEARALIEDGIPVAPLPFIPRAKVN